MLPLLLIGWLVGPAEAYDPEQPEVRVVSVESGTIKVDGDLDEAVWSSATPITDLLRHRPQKGGPPPCPTEIRFLQDDKNLYVGARVYDCDYKVRSRIGARERINEDDQIGVYFDTFGDGRTGYLFYINPHGVQQDIRNSNGNWSFAWNTAFTTRGQRHEDGYTIEMAFPWRSLKYSRDEDPVWGVVVTRVVPHLGAKYSFPQIEDGHPRVMTLAAPLVGLDPPRRGSGLEIIPGITAGQAWPREDGSTAGFDPWHQVLRPSLDLRYGITPDLGITATVNPDFSQVEADVPDVRVNPRFSFQFPETRPFFLDGFEYYRDTPNTLYTRSINEPTYGVKISGQEGPVAIGVLNTLDRSPLASFNANGTPGFSSRDVVGRTALNNVVRLRVDAFESGFLGVTYADKRLLGEATDPSLSDGAGVFQAGGMDIEFPMGKRWRSRASTLQTATGIEGGPISWGSRNAVVVERIKQFGTNASFWANDATPEYRLETGFAPQSGLTSFGTNAFHNANIDRFVDTIRPRAWVDATLERDGDRLVTSGGSFQIKMADVHTFETSGRAVEQIEAGVPFLGWAANASYSSNPVAWLQMGPQFEIGRAFDYSQLAPGTRLKVDWSSSLFPITWLRLDTLGSWERFETDVPGPAGDPRQAALFRNLLNVQFSRELGMRVIESWTTNTLDGPELASSFLLSWIKVPGTAAYVGLSERTDLESGEMIERTVFAKASVLLRP